MFSIGKLFVMLAIGWGLQAQTKIDLGTQVKGVLSLANGGTGAITASAARANLGVPAAAGGTMTNPNLIISGCADGYAVYMTNALVGSLGCLPFTGGAPAGAKYIVQQADAGLAGAQVLGSLTTGMLKVTTGTGVLSVAAAADLPTHASRHQNGGNDEVATATPAANAIPKAGAGGTLAAGWLPTTGVSANTYGSTSTIPSFTVGADGRLTFAGNTTPALPASAITSGILDTARMVTGSIINLRCLHLNASGVIEVTAQDCNTGSGDVLGPATNTDGFVPVWNGNNSKTLANGNCLTQSGAANCIPRLTGTTLNLAGIVSANGFTVMGSSATTSIFAQSSSSSPQIELRRANVFTSTNILQISDNNGTALSYIDGNGNFTGRASTASALAGSPTGCAAGSLIHSGIDTQGNSLGCGKVQLDSEVAGNLPVTNLAGGSGAGPTTFWRGDGVWAVPAGGGGGLTSVGLSVPGEFNISNNPLVANGNITLAWANANQGYVMAGPAGGSGTPAFRALVAGDIPNLDAAKLTTGTVPVARGGTGQSSFTGSKCVTSDSGGTALTSAAGPCLVGPGTSVNGNLVTWSGTTGTTLSSVSYEARSTVPSPVTASTVVTRDGTYGGSGIRDNGEQIWNVKAFGAKGDGSTDDRAALQLAIDSAPGTGGIVFLPAGDYVINSTNGSDATCGLVVGNGSPTTDAGYSTINQILLLGVGSGSFEGEDGAANAQRGATRILKGASGPSKLICFKGPMIGGGVKDMHLDAGASGGATALDLRHTSRVDIDNVTMKRFTGTVINIYGVMTSRSGGTQDWTNPIPFYACHNRIMHSVIADSGATAIALNLDGAYQSVGTPSYHSACSNLVMDSDFRAGTSSTYVVNLGLADNNQFFRNEFKCGDSICASGGVRLRQPQAGDSGYGGVDSGKFPYGNHFQALVSGFTGTGGTGGNSALDFGEQEGYPDPTVANVFWITDAKRIKANATGTMPTDCSTTSGRAYIGADSSGTDLFAFGRGAGSGNGFQVCSEYDVLLSARKGTKPSRGSTLSEINAFSPQPSAGTIVYCTDCTQGTSTCTGSGSGTMAFRLNGAWKCF